MMFSMEKCSGHSCTGTSEDSKLFTGGGEEMGKEGVPTDEVASAVAAVSDEIGDILKDELGDVERTERMGAELADLSAELGILAGLADGETQQHFPALFEIAMNQTDSGSGSGSSGSSGSSSSWSNEQRWRSRRPARPPRAPRRPIAKGKELSRRRGAGSRPLRARRPPSDASDVGADSDSDSHWTDINTGSSDSSTSKEGSAADAECNGFGDKPLLVEGRVMGQLLLPLLCTEPVDHRELYIRHDHIVKSLISAEEVARAELRLEEVLASDNASDNDVDLESAPVTPEEEAALLQYVCEAEPAPPVQTIAQENDAVRMCVCGGACSCTVCAHIYSKHGAPALLAALLRALAANSNTYPSAVGMMRAIGLQSGNTEKALAKFNSERFKKIHFCDEATAIIHEHLTRLVERTGGRLYEICQCKPVKYVDTQANAVEGLMNILDGYRKIALNYSVQVLLRESEQKKLLASMAGGDTNNTDKLNAGDDATATAPGFKSKHRCDCQTPNAWCAQKWQQMISRSTLGVSPVNNKAPENEKNADTPLETKRVLQQGDGTGAKPPDSNDMNSLALRNQETDPSDCNALDDLSGSESSWSSGGGGGRGGGAWRGVAQLMRCIASVERLMDRVLRAACPPTQQKRVDIGMSEVDRKLMAMYRRLPEVHRRQLQVYRKQKKLSNVCMQLVGGRAPPPPAPGSPPPAPAHAVCRALALHYHLHHIKQVRRKVMHMRDQQLYYHRLRSWLENQLRAIKDGTTNHLAIEDAPRNKKSLPNSDGNLIKSHKILQLLRQKAPIDFVEDFKNEGYRDTDEEVDPPEAFPLEKDNNISDSDTIVGEKETQEFCKEMKECLVKFANFALDNADEELIKEYEIQADEEAKFPEAVSPPLQEMSPTTPESLPVYTPKPSQRLLTANKVLNLNNIDFKDDRVDFTLPPDLNIPVNARRTPVLVNDNENVEELIMNDFKSLMQFDDYKEFVDKIDSENPVGVKSALDMAGGLLYKIGNTIVNNPELLNRILKYEIPPNINELIPDGVKLSDEAMRQIRDMKLKARSTVKVTKNTAKRKIYRKLKNSNDNDADEDQELDANSTDNSNNTNVGNTNSKDEDEERESAIKMFDDLVKNTLSLEEMKDMFKSTVRKDVTSKIPVALIDHEQEELFENIIIKDLAKNEADSITGKILDRIEDYRKKYDDDYESEEGCEASKEQLREATRRIIYSVDDTFDCLIMTKMSQENFQVLKCLKFKYIDILKRCANSRQLVCWIVHEPDVAANIIHELANLPPRNDNLPELKLTAIERKKEYFLERLKRMNRLYMETLPKKSITGKDWLILLYKLEKLKEKFTEQFQKVRPMNSKPQNTTQNASEAEILAAKGLSKIIGKANASKPKQTNIEPVKEDTDTVQSKENDDKRKNTEAILAKGEAILMSRGDKSLMKSLYIIRSCINQGLPLPEVHKNHIVSICSGYEKLLDENLREALYSSKADADSPQLKEIIKNANQMFDEEPQPVKGHPEDCECAPCQQAEAFKMALWFKMGREEDDKEKTKAQEKVEPPPVQHVCKGGHTNNGSCVGESSPDQPCTCCYCTVFGHAPPVTTPVPRNFNETRERLRSILHKKKQKCKTDELDGNQVSDPPPSINKPKPQLMPPALPKCLPPSLTPTQAQKRQAIEKQQKMLADKMAALSVENKTEVDILPDQNQPQIKHKSPPLPMLKAEPLQPSKPPPQQVPQQKPQQMSQQKPQQMSQQKKNPEPIYDIPIHNRPSVNEQHTQTAQHKPTLTAQQQQQIWQQQQQQRGRQKERAVSVSSRDTSVFSTTSDSSADYYWRGNRTEDPRDLDALLQYIEGPGRQVDREKKRAKKQRQKLKRIETQLEVDVRKYATLIKEQQAVVDKRKVELNFTKKRMADIIASKPKLKKGKKQMLSAAQLASIELIDEQIRDVTVIIKAAEQNVQENERQLSAMRRDFNACVDRLDDLRAQKNQALAQQQRQEHTQMQQQQLQQQQQEQACNQQLQPVTGKHLQMVQLDRQKPVGALSTMCVRGGGVVRVRRCAAASPDLAPRLVKVVPVTSATLQQQAKPKTEKPPEPKKQSWEQALAHINQLAKSSKEKKKQKEQEQPAPKSAEKRGKDAQKKQQVEVEEPPLSKKQRKLLAKQQAEEEERLREQQELEKLKKANKKAAKSDAKKTEKQAASDKKSKEQKKAEKETKRAEKEKSKDKLEKNAPVHQPKSTKTQLPAPPQPSKKEKKKNKEQQQMYYQSTTPVCGATTTNETVFKSTASESSSSGGGGCSIMQQLSSGVQVGELRLPPGITLTRLQPARARPPDIHSVPAWKSSQLAAQPTPVARPPPVIHAAPTPVQIPEQPIIVAEPSRPTCPPFASKSKKSKKKAKKQEEPAKQEPAKMVTLRNPMFHPNAPPVQVNNAASNLRVPEPIPMPGGCQATITPAANGMYTIRNPLMAAMHQQQQSMLRSPYPQYSYEPPAPAPQPQPPPPRSDVNLASFAQNNVDGYTLFSSSRDSPGGGFLAQDNHTTGGAGGAGGAAASSPGPIGTRPLAAHSLFAHNTHHKPPQPIGTPAQPEQYKNLYTPFPQDGDVFRNSLFSHQAPADLASDLAPADLEGDLMPYFQRLRVGSKLNSEVTIHHVTESKFYKQESPNTGWPGERNEGYGPPVCDQEQDAFSRYQYLFQRRN